MTDKNQFGAGPLFGCSNCFAVVWIEPDDDGTCPACEQIPESWDVLHIIPDNASKKYPRWEDEPETTLR